MSERKVIDRCGSSLASGAGSCLEVYGTMEGAMWQGCRMACMRDIALQGAMFGSIWHSGRRKRVDAWKIAHTGKDGNVLPNAQEKWDKIEEVERRRKSMSGTIDDSEDSDDFENDAIAEVFGLDKKNRCRAMTSSASVKKVRYGLAAKEIAKQKSVLMAEKIQMRIEANIKTTVKTAVKEAMKQFVTLNGAQHSKPDSELNISGDAQRTEGASNKHHTQLIGKASNDISDRVQNSDTRQYVMMCSREEKEVAKDYIASHAMCHQRSVAHDERIVWVSEVIDPETPIYEAPQGGNYRLCEITDGGFLIWPKSHLRYL